MEKKGAISLKNINKFYGKNQILHDLSFDIKPGEFLSLLGPSGCGKTTILRLIAGLEYLDSGEIYMDGKRIDHLEPYKRNLNTIFQNYALFPHMNVKQNIAYGLKAKWLGRNEIEEKVAKVMERVQLKGFEKRQPNQMSGGQRQRVSIARAIVNEAPVLLLDEPLTALDLKLRKEMRYELRSLQKQLGVTFVFVTHDQEEAIIMSDRIAVMNQGVIEQVGTPAEIYSHPVSQFVAEFIGETNVFEGIILEGNDSDEIQIQMESGFSSAAPKQRFKPGEFVNCSIRPDKVLFGHAAVEGFEIPGVVTERIFSGAFVKSVVRLKNNKEIQISRIAGEMVPEIGESIYIYWNRQDAEIMKTRSELIYTGIEYVDLSPWNKLNS